MSVAFDPADRPHRCRNLLSGNWVLVSPHRAARPWQGETEDTRRHAWFAEGGAVLLDDVVAA